jgi:hypothetical protein
MRVLKGTALFIALVQLVLGFAYTFAPAAFNAALGLSGAPDWTGWPFGMMGARFIAFGFGMVLVFLNPMGNRSWVQAMIGVQTIDWLATMYYVGTGVVTLNQVASASFLPVLFIIALVVFYPRQNAKGEQNGRAV